MFSMKQIAYKEMSANKLVHFFILVVLSLLVIVPAIANHVSVNLEIAVRLAQFKVPVLILMLALAGIFLILKGKILWKPALLSVLYPTYYLIISILYKDSIELSVVALYFFWSFYVFILVPVWVTKERFDGALLVLLASGFILVVYGLVSEYLGLNTWDLFKNRDSYGYPNPNLYAQYVQLVFFTMCLLKFRNKFSVKQNYVFYLIVIVLFYLVVKSYSRNVFLVMSVFGVLIFISKTKYKKIIIAGFFVLLIMALFLADYDTINRISSRRLDIWMFYIGEVINQGIGSVLVGAHTVPVVDFVPKYNHLPEAVVNTEKFRADNIYVELFVESGLIGLVLFFMPIAYLISRSGLGLKAGSIANPFLYAMLLQGVLITNMTSFFSPAALLFGSVLMPLYLSEKALKR